MQFFQSAFARSSRFPIDFHVQDIHPDWEIVAQQYQIWLERGKNILKNDQYPIPKIIHQIWIGSPLPTAYIKWCNTWKKFNPSYVYKLWTDPDINFRSEVTLAAYNETNNIGAKSDIARYEILDRFGGIYCDTDLECIKNLDELIYNTTFATCSLFSDSPHFGNGFIACSPSHPIITGIISEIDAPITTRDVIQIINDIGPGLLTKKTIEYLRHNADPSLALLPSNFCYPWPNYLRSDKNRPKTYITPDSIALHYWEMSWTRVSLSTRVLLKAKALLLSALRKFAAITR